MDGGATRAIIAGGVFDVSSPSLPFLTLSRQEAAAKTGKARLRSLFPPVNRRARLDASNEYPPSTSDDLKFMWVVVGRAQSGHGDRCDSEGRDMKVLVIGATGQTGRHVMKSLLDQGHDVTAFARQPSAIQQKNDRLRVAQGDVRDAGALDQAVTGHDAVVAAFGPRTLGKTDLQEVFMRNLVAAMKNHGVTRLVNLSVWGSGGGAVPQRNLIARYFFFPIILRQLLADKRRGEASLFGSDLDYTNVCPGYLKNSPARGGVRASIDGKGLQQVMHREDLASFMVEQLVSKQWVRKCVVVGY